MLNPEPFSLFFPVILPIIMQRLEKYRFMQVSLMLSKEHIIEYRG